MTAPPPRPVLIVDDDPLQRRMLRTLLRRKLGYEAYTAENGRDALRILDKDMAGEIKLVLLDLDMPVMDGMAALKRIQKTYSAISVLIITARSDAENAAEAMRLGAIDYITKPFKAERLTITVKNAVQIGALSQEITHLRERQKGISGFDDLIGHDGGLAGLVRIGHKAATSDIPVLLTGETGTGKDIFAQAIHGESERATQPFVAVNCGAIPAQLVESTLFGHEKGAFTGANAPAKGKFREADGGVIFLDEVGELPLDAQVKLLRVLQQAEVEPVGGGGPVAVNVRIISATNKDLSAEVKAGRFREDLYFRLNVLHIDLPPLRERAEDIPALAQHFITNFAAREGILPKTLPRTAIRDLMTYHWPGNIRQLENIINRAMVMSEGQKLHLQDLGAPSPQAASQDLAGLDILIPAPQDIRIIDEQGRIKPIRDIEHAAMTMVLAHCEGNITQAAKALGMAKSTFYKKLKTSPSS